MRKALVLSVLMSLAVNAHAVDLGLRHTSGKDGYQGNSAYAQLPAGSLSIRPAADFVKSDNLHGTFKTYSLRLGYDTSIYGFGATAGMTPKVDGYQNIFGGADLTVTLSATGGGSKRSRTSGGGAPRGKGLARVDVGAGALVTRHQDGLNPSRVKRLSTRELTQTDLSLFAQANVVGFNVSGNFTKSAYDKNPGVGDRPAQVLKLEGLETRLMGYPKNSLMFRAEAPYLPLVNPFVSYTRTSYEQNSLKTQAYGIGAYVGLEMLELFGVIERIVPSSGSENTSVTLGASVRFGLGG